MREGDDERCTYIVLFAGVWGVGLCTLMTAALEGGIYGNAWAMMRTNCSFTGRKSWSKSNYSISCLQCRIVSNIHQSMIRQSNEPPH
jgi:hypothetical protein